jgi:hypothetical protein|tara:strand:- start:477 stop:986 length:510 start_codon:yes stop_codon:yes gene_type:complete
MATIILLKENELTKNTLLGGNIDIDLYIPCIADAQRTRLEEILGETLYNKICEDFDNDDLVDEYLTLYEDYIKPFLISQSAVEYLLIGAYKVNNNGIFKAQPDNSVAVDKTEVDYLVNNMRMKAEMYQARMEKWLCRFPLPEYRSSSNNIVNPIRTRLVCGKWWLDNPY